MLPTQVLLWKVQNSFPLLIPPKVPSMSPSNTRKNLFNYFNFNTSYFHFNLQNYFIIDPGVIQEEQQLTCTSPFLLRTPLQSSPSNPLPLFVPFCNLLSYVVINPLDALTIFCSLFFLLKDFFCVIITKLCVCLIPL